MKKKTLILWIVIFTVLCFFVYKLFDKENEPIVNESAIAFSKEYTLVGEENIFVYSTEEEILNIIDKGRGVIFFCYPSSTLCQHYAKVLNAIAIKSDVNKISYYNIKDDIEKETEFYHKMLTINGNLSIPKTLFVKNGRIVYIDNETSNIDYDPDMYWNVDTINIFDTKIKKYFEDIFVGTCENDC